MNKNHIFFPVLLVLYSFYLKYTDDVWFSVFVMAGALFCWVVIFGNEIKNQKNQDR